MTQAELRNIRGHAKGVRVNINLVFIGDRPEWHLLNLLCIHRGQTTVSAMLLVFKYSGVAPCHVAHVWSCPTFRFT